VVRRTDKWASDSYVAISQTSDDPDVGSGHFGTAQRRVSCRLSRELVPLSQFLCIQLNSITRTAGCLFHCIHFIQSLQEGGQEEKETPCEETPILTFPRSVLLFYSAQ
jgi:hypothetical protein